MSRVISPAIVNDTLLTIDLGKKGAVCYNKLFGGPIHVAELPQTCQGLSETIKHIVPDIIVAENVRSMQAFAGHLMIARGRLEGICAALNIKLVFIEPLAWMECYTHQRKKHFKGDTQWKNHLRDIARQLFGKKLDSGEADAMLMWNYYASIIVNDKLTPKHKLAFS